MTNSMDVKQNFPLRNAAEHREFKKFERKYFESQRELPTKRDFRWQAFRWITRKDRDNYRKNFDLAFPNSPGAGL